ncbi:MAG TPA: type II secretion system protein M [Burkholderiaceae bacterium]|nr:type II secretion system protein M [Burkholderiaceae bacterium]
MEALKQFWAERAPRERSILLIGGILMVAVIAYLIAIEPAWTGIARLEKSLPQQRANAAELEALLAEVKALKGRPAVATMSATDARGALESSLTKAGMKATRIVPLSDGDVQLTFADVPISKWAPWLASIERELGARATAVTVAGRDATPGNVDVELALRLARK